MQPVSHVSLPRLWPCRPLALPGSPPQPSSRRNCAGVQSRGPCSLAGGPVLDACPREDLRMLLWGGLGDEGGGGDIPGVGSRPWGSESGPVHFLSSQVGLRLTRLLCLSRGMGLASHAVTLWYSVVAFWRGCRGLWVRPTPARCAMPVGSRGRRGGSL